MRNLTTVLAIILINTLYGQTNSTTEIILKTSIDKENFIQMLIENDNFVDTENYGVITTVLRNSKTKPNWSHQYHYRIVFKADSIIIKPYWTMNITIDLGVAEAESQLEKWNYSTRKNINGFIHQETIEMLNNAGYTDISYN